MNTHFKFHKIAATAALLLTTTAGWAAGAGLVRLGGNAPNMGGATYLKSHDPNEVLNLTIALKLQNTAQLAGFLKAVQDPHSLQYRHFLTTAQTTKLYGPTQIQVNSVVAYLKSQGIKVADVSPDRLLVHAGASTATLQRAFGVNIDDYSLNGATYFAPDNNPRVRGDIATLVTAVMGLDNVVVLQPHLRTVATAAPSASTVAGGPGPGGYSPQQIAAAYSWPDITNTANGAGVTIGIATAFTYRTTDIQTFWSTYKLPSHTLVNVPVDGVTRRLNDETTLDVEHSSSMAPGAKVVVYSGVNPQFQTFVDVFDTIKNDATNKPDVITTSWGSCEPNTPPASIGAEDSVFLLMLAQGQTIFAAAGDGGSQDRCVTATGANSGPGQGGLLTISSTDNADFPSSDPGVGAAGGTHLVLNGNSVVSESAWSSGGGADSQLFAQPAYESALTSNTSCFADTNTDAFNIDASVACAATGNASRQSADLSMDADPGTPYSFYFNGRWGLAGGTSFVAPELAGLWAIAVQADRTAHSNNTLRLGSAPVSIYVNCGGTTRDITTGSNGAFSAGSGWDHPTGFGVPQATNLVSFLSSGC